MWTPEDIEIEVSRNGITPIGFQLFDCLTDEPLDITGETIICKVALALGEPLIATPAVTLQDTSLGQFDITFDGSQIPISAGSQETVRISYEVKTAAGITIMRGPLILIPGI